MPQNRHVLSISLDDKLLKDIDYACGTSGKPIKRSRAIEKILREAIPARLSTPKKKYR